MRGTKPATPPQTSRSSSNSRFVPTFRASYQYWERLCSVYVLCMCVVEQREPEAADDEIVPEQATGPVSRFVTWPRVYVAVFCPSMFVVMRSSAGGQRGRCKRGSLRSGSQRRPQLLWYVHIIIHLFLLRGCPCHAWYRCNFAEPRPVEVSDRRRDDAGAVSTNSFPICRCYPVSPPSLVSVRPSQFVVLVARGPLGFIGASFYAALVLLSSSQHTHIPTNTHAHTHRSEIDFYGDRCKWTGLCNLPFVTVKQFLRSVRRLGDAWDSSEVVFSSDGTTCVSDGSGSRCT